MARQLLLSDDEESFLVDALRTNLRLAEAMKVLHGDLPQNQRTEVLMRALLRKLGIDSATGAPDFLPDYAEDQSPSPDPVQVVPPGMDLDALAKSIQSTFDKAAPGAIPTRIERVSMPIYASLLAADAKRNGYQSLLGKSGRDLQTIAEFSMRATAAYFIAHDQEAKA